MRPPNTPRVKVLMVDDRPENLFALEMVLDPLGEELVKAASGNEALKRLLQDDFAVILLDVQMPGMDGFEAARLIRERERSRGTPIIFLTAISKEEQHIGAGYESGAVDYVTKPFVPEHLRAKVAVFVDLCRQRQIIARQAELLQQHGRDLERINDDLKAEIQERMKAETALALSNAGLHESARKMREMNEQRTRFFANISHELRNPLALILGPVSQRLLAGAGMPPEQRELLEMVESSARMLLKQVNDLLDVSKLEAGKMETHYASTDLARLLRLTVSCFDLVAQDRGITLSVAAPDSVPAQADPEKIHRVLMNLLANAIKFTPRDGRVNVTLRLAERGRSPRASIAVLDSGPGVPPEMRATIFERFRQADSGPGPQFGGTGLGLAIVKDFVELHGGAVQVSDAPGGGALFTVDLPLVAPPGVVVAASQRVGEPPPAALEDTSLVLEQFRGLRLPASDAVIEEGGEGLILVVEDHPTMNDFLVKTLATRHRVATAFDGRDGLGKALALHPDLILTDVMMPGITGEDLVRDIRLQRELDAAPIVVLTARADDELRLKLLREGAQDYLIKPFSAQELLLRVGNLLTMKRIRDLLHREVVSQERDVVAVVKDLIETRERLEKALAAGREGEP